MASLAGQGMAILEVLRANVTEGRETPGSVPSQADGVNRALTPRES